MMNKFHHKQVYDLSKFNIAKIGVLSDTHCHINPLVVEQLSSCDVILHAGDIGSYDVIQQLNELCNCVISVCGNNDNALQWKQSEHAQLQSIPQIAEVILSGGIINITHGDEYYAAYPEWHTQLRKNFSTAKAIIYGHSHRSVCDQNEQPWILNPGAAGKTRIQKHGVSCLLIHMNNQEWSIEKYCV